MGTPELRPDQENQLTTAKTEAAAAISVELSARGATNSAQVFRPENNPQENTRQGLVVVDADAILYLSHRVFFWLSSRQGPKVSCGV